MVIHRLDFLSIIINAAIKIVILNPSLCHSERSEESRRYAQDRLRNLAFTEEIAAHLSGARNDLCIKRL